MAYIQRALVDNNRSLGKRAAPGDAVLATNPAYYASLDKLVDSLVCLDLQATSTGQYGNLPLDPLVISGTYPSEQQVVNWIDLNFDMKGRVIPPGSLLYWKGSGTASNPDLIYMYAKDGNLALDVPIKLIKSPVSSSGSTQNIYNSDGTLSSDRIVNAEGNDFTIAGTGLMSFGSADARLEVDAAAQAVKVTGDVKVVSSLNGVVLKDSDNVHWRITVMPGGILRTNQI